MASGGSFGAIHRHPDAELRNRLTQLLKSLLEDVVGHFGQNCVLKELRPISNSQTVDLCFQQLGVPVSYLMLETDPLMTMYTHYRFGALAQHPHAPNTEVDDLYRRRVENCRDITINAQISSNTDTTTAGKSSP